MAIVVKGWVPDTCGCLLWITVDDSLPADQPYGIHSVGRACPNHAGLTRDETLAAALDENRRRSNIVEAIKANFSKVAQDVPDGVGGSSKEFKKGHEPVWQFDNSQGGKNRKLLLSFPTLNASEKAQAQALVDSIVGSGKADVS